VLRHFIAPLLPYLLMRMRQGRRRRLGAYAAPTLALKAVVIAAWTHIACANTCL